MAAAGTRLLRKGLALQGLVGRGHIDMCGIGPPVMIMYKLKLTGVMP